jgi:prephenate dehydratase
LIALPLIKREVERKFIAAVEAVEAGFDSIAVAAKPAFTLYEYAIAQKPVRQDISRFILMYDTIGKKTFNYDDINSSLLVKLRDRPTMLYVHIFGLKLANSEELLIRMIISMPCSNYKSKYNIYYY